MSVVYGGLKMGLYICEKKEIYDALKKALDDLEGDVQSHDFREMANELADNYKNFSDLMD